MKRFGNYSGTSEIEAVAVDDELGYVYFADEGHGIRKWHADPDHPDANRELAVFGSSGFEIDREGIGICRMPTGAAISCASIRFLAGPASVSTRAAARKGVRTTRIDSFTSSGSRPTALTGWKWCEPERYPGSRTAP